MSPEAEPSQDVLTTVRKRIELVINEIEDAEVIAMLRTAMSELDLVLAQSDAEPVCPRCGGRGSHMHPKTAWEDRLDFVPPRAEPVAWHSTPAMRARIRELSRPNSDDYDKAVIAVLDDFEAALAQTDVGPVAWPDIDAAVKAGLAWRNPAPDAAPSAHSDAKTVTIGDTAPPRPDASAGLIEAAEVVAEAERYRDFYPPDSDGFNTFSLFASKFRARAADMSGK